MNNRTNLRQEIEEFINNDNEKIMLIYGTHQYEKHKEVLRSINNLCKKGVKVLFRGNSMGNFSSIFENHDFRPKTGTKYNFGNMDLYLDSINKTSWRNDRKYNISILYPLDSICSKSKMIRDEIINDLLHKTVHKIFLVTWTDNVCYDWLEEDGFNIDRTVVFDVEEENPEYHKRMLDCISKKYDNF